MGGGVVDGVPPPFCSVGGLSSPFCRKSFATGRTGSRIICDDRSCPQPRLLRSIEAATAQKPPLFYASFLLKGDVSRAKNWSHASP